MKNDGLTEQMDLKKKRECHTGKGVIEVLNGVIASGFLEV